MKIIYICGCLEPGKDGVGDYTRRLSAELIRQNINVGIIAYKDAYVHNIERIEQFEDKVSILCLRLPEKLPYKERVIIAKEWINLNNPEWLSLQFVPYSFNSKGLPFGLGSQLKSLGGNRKWHIMFHELWLGLRNKDSLKYRAIGAIQKKIICSLKHYLRVKLVHTHTQFYYQELEKINYSPKYLPLFGNIPLFTGFIDPNIQEHKIVFVIFGAIHAGAPVQQFAKELSVNFNSKNGKSPLLYFIGRSGNEKSKWINEFLLHNIEVEDFGELPTSEISKILQVASYGITTNPIFVAEKSGTVAAMLEHELPVIIVAEDVTPRKRMNFDFGENLIEYKVGNLNKIIKHKTFKFTKRGVSEVTTQFLKEFKIA